MWGGGVRLRQISKKLFFVSPTILEIEGCLKKQDKLSGKPDKFAGEPKKLDSADFFLFFFYNYGSWSVLI